MRYTFSSNSQLAHVWAQRSQSEGRTGHMFFDGDTIYSYGRHYAIAKFHFRKSQPFNTLVLMNSTSYSNSTAKHKSHVWRAIPNRVPTISVPDPTASRFLAHEVNMSHFQRELERTAIAFKRTRKHAELLKSEHESLVDAGNRYKEFFRLKGKKFRSLLNSKEIDQKMTAQREFAKKERERRQAEHEVAVLKWVNGDNSLRHHISRGTQYLRMKDADTVETSTGAEFPLSHALLALRKIRKCASTATSWHRNGEEIRVGHFHVDSIDEEGNVKAGCHFIPNAEIERFARTIGK
jgi:hypothetical protein